MTPKEKAEELFSRYYVMMLETDSEISEEITISILSKQCSIIAVNEVIADANNKVYHIGRNGLTDYDYWWEVKQEIEKL